MKVLVLGASGFIGNSVSLALVRAGHEVIGQTRSRDTVKSLERQEIKALVSDPVKDRKSLESIDSTQAIIDCLGGLAQKKDLCMDRIRNVEGAKRNKTAHKVSYIWTTGIFVHGDHFLEFRHDGMQCLAPNDMVAWKLDVETYLVESQAIDGIVIRPGIVYGSSAGVTGMLFKQATEGLINWPGHSRVKWATIHQNDLGELYALAVAHTSLVKHLRIEASNPYSEPVEEILVQLAAIANIDANDVHFTTPNTDFERAMACTVKVRPDIAQKVLGWLPKMPSLSDGIVQYYQAYLAYQ